MYTVTIRFTESDSMPLHVTGVKEKPEYTTGGTCGAIVFNTRKKVYSVRESAVDYLELERTG